MSSNNEIYYSTEIQTFSPTKHTPSMAIFAPENQRETGHSFLFEKQKAKETSHLAAPQAQCSTYSAVHTLPLKYSVPTV